MPKVKQQEKAKETLDIFAPLAHRLGIHAIKWELEDLAFATLHPRKYAEIKGLVNQQRTEREGYVARAGEYLGQELQAVGIESEISGRAKHFYSIYSKMTKKGREFNEIFDLTAMRVRVGSVKDCYGAIRARPSGSRSRSTAGTARGCSRTSRAALPRRGSTSSRRAAPSCTRWSRTASWSRWGTPRH